MKLTANIRHRHLNGFYLDIDCQDDKVQQALSRKIRTGEKQVEMLEYIASAQNNVAIRADLIKDGVLPWHFIRFDWIALGVARGKDLLNNENSKTFKLTWPSGLVPELQKRSIKKDWGK